MKFRLLHGRHAVGGGRTADGKTTPAKVYVAGDVIEASQDLEKLFNVGTFRKFERLHEDIAVTTPQEASHSTLDAMTLEELRQFAAAEEIDLGKARTKAEIIHVIRNNS